MFTNSITILLKFIFRYRIVTMLPHIAEEIPPIPIAIIPITVVYSTTIPILRNRKTMIAITVICPIVPVKYNLIAFFLATELSTSFLL